MIKSIISFCCIVSFIACGNSNPKEGSANHHMHNNSFEELAAKFEDSERKEWQKPELVISKFGLIQGKKVADIGAGTGYFSRVLANKGASVIAIDVDQQFLDYIDSHSSDSLDIETRLVPFDKPKLDSSEVDAVLIVDTYHHIENRHEYFRKVWRGLKAGGQLMVVDFKKVETSEGPPVEMRIAGIDVMRELQQAGFVKVVIDVKTLDYQYIITAKKYEKAK